MTRKDFLYALENAWIIECVRDENNNIDVEETVKSWEFNSWCYCNWERFSPKVVYKILEDEWAFDD